MLAAYRPPENQKIAAFGNSYRDFCPGRNLGGAFAHM
jgi:hypothetical protein